MPWFGLAFILGVILIVGGSVITKGAVWLTLGLLVLLSAIPVMLCIDIPNRDRRDAIPANACIECKIRVEDKFYAVGCDGHQYTINMSAWALLNTSECK